MPGQSASTHTAGIAGLLSGLLGQGWDEEEGCREGKVNSAAPAKLRQHNMNDTLT
jgi:hypothetical protein